MSPALSASTIAELDQVVRVKRATLLARHPFFGILINYLRLEGHPATWFEERGLCATMATDGVRLLYAYEFVDELRRDAQHDYIAGVLAHEILHPGLGHIWRRDFREPLLWNIAADCRVNLILKNNGIDLPDDCVTIKPGWETLSEEEIYERLRKTAMQSLVAAAKGSRLGAGDILPSPSAADGAGGQGGHNPAAAGVGVDPAKLAEEWKDRLIRAAQATKSQGTCPAGISELVDDILTPQHDWRTLLAHFVQPYVHDYDWLRPDRRLLGAYGLYLPTLSGDQIENVVVAIDTSGSISSTELQMFLAELRAILQAYSRVHVYLAVCDAALWQFDELTSDDPVPHEVKGRGGTDFRPVFDEIERRGLTPSALVFLTDGYGTYPDRAPSYPLLWVLTPNHEEPPFGTTAVLSDIA